ncbi:MAG: hypothetical protein U0P46_14435 [Holophagaceae bacterium]
MRDLGQIDKALANFKKANKLDPNHVQSLLQHGRGVFLDLHKPEEAAKAWNKVIALAHEQRARLPRPGRCSAS